MFAFSYCTPAGSVDNRNRFVGCFTVHTNMKPSKKASGPHDVSWELGQVQFGPRAASIPPLHCLVIPQEEGVGGWGGGAGRLETEVVERVNQRQISPSVTECS